MARLLPLLVATVAMAQTGGEPEALLEQGQACLAAGNYQCSQQRGEEAARLFHSRNDSRKEALALNLAGSSEIYRGRYESGIRYYQQALELDRGQQDAQGEINRLNNIAGAYFFQGRYLDALAGYEEVLRKSEANGREAWGPNRRQMALTNLAVLYEQLGQNQKALDYYRQALTGERALAPAQYGQLLSNAGTLYRHLGDAVKALRMYRQAEEFFAREHLSDSEIHVLQNVGIAQALDLADAHAAEQAFSDALTTAEATGNQREIVLAHLFRGEACLRVSQWDRAREDFDRALAGARMIGGKEEEWTALYGVARVERHAGHTKEALATLHRSIEAIEGMRSGLAASSLKAEFLANKRDVYDAAIGLTLEAGSWNPGALFHLFEQARGAAASLEAVQSRLGKAVLLEYWIGDGKLAVFRVARDGSAVKTQEWGRQQEAGLRTLVDALRNGGSDWRARAGELGSQLLADVPEGADLLIVPDGPLYQIPFEALPVSSGGSLEIEKAAVSYLPSAAALAGEPIRARYRAPWRRQWVGFGDPVRNAGAALPGDDQWPRLPESARELRSIARELPGHTVLRMGADDRKRYLLEESLGATPILHFATHAVADTTDPNRSRIFFTPEPGSQGSGYLFRPEVQGLPLRDTELVVLSACDTEAGKVVRGDGVQSFSRSFLAAGARATVTTLWRVEDRATAEFMQIFYRHLAAGESKGGALRAAKLEFLRQGGRRAHPQSWAAFVLNGDAQSPIRPVFGWLWISAMIAAIAAAGILAVAIFRLLHSRAGDRRRS